MVGEPSGQFPVAPLPISPSVSGAIVLGGSADESPLLDPGPVGFGSQQCLEQHGGHGTVVSDQGCDVLFLFLSVSCSNGVRRAALAHHFLMFRQHQCFCLHQQSATNFQVLLHAAGNFLEAVVEDLFPGVDDLLRENEGVFGSDLSACLVS